MTPPQQCVPSTTTQTFCDTRKLWDRCDCYLSLGRSPFLLIAGVAHICDPWISVQQWAIFCVFNFEDVYRMYWTATLNTLSPRYASSKTQSGHPITGLARKSAKRSEWENGHGLKSSWANVGCHSKLFFDGKLDMWIMWRCLHFIQATQSHPIYSMPRSGQQHQRYRTQNASEL